MRKYATGLTFVILMGCGGKTSHSTPDAVIDADAARWENPRLIPICFLNQEDVSREIYDDILNNAVVQFARAGVHFKKWRACETDDLKASMIRVKFKLGHQWEGSGGYSYGGGKSKVGMTRRGLQNENGATLWIKVDSKYPATEGRKRDNVMAATRSAFLHEIGHALGLLHEHTRTDYRPDAGECEAAADHANVPENTDRIDYIGRPDYDSVMSYCNLRVEKLSPGDIAGIHALYPELRE